MFRQIPIEISVGCSVILMTPVQVPSTGLPIVELIHSIVSKIKVQGIEKWIYAEDPKNPRGYLVVPEWRVVRYTYGGIWLDNHKFDQDRIDAQNLNIISQKSLNTSTKKSKLGVGNKTKP